MNYRKEIDGLRGVAVLSVIFYHAGFGVFSGGFVGVDIFFVISGFLIASIIKAGVESGNFYFVRFYEKRARRILPALFFVMLFSIPFAWMFLLPYDLKDFFESLFAIPIFLANHLFLNESGYFAAPAENKPLLHTWSLSVEEQFYLIFPLIIFISLKSKIKSISFYVLILLFAVSFTLSIWYTKFKPDMAFYVLPTRAWEFLIGSMITFIKLDEFVFFQKKIADAVFSMVGAVMVMGSIFFLNKSTPFPGLYAIVPTLGTALIIAFANEENLVGRLLTHRVSVGVGLVSYSAYLWHQPVFAFIRYQTNEEPGVGVFLALIAAVLFLAFLSWKYIENYFRAERGISRKSFFLVSVGGMVFFMSIGLFGHLVEPMKLATMRFDEDKLRTINSVAHSPYRDQCHFDQSEKSLTKTPCTYFSSNVSVAVFGNSHGAELAYSLAEELKSLNIGVVHHTMSGCTHTYRVDGERNTVCGRWHENVYLKLIQDKLIKTVVLSYRNEISLQDEKYRNSLVQLANDLADSGKRVILVLQAPMPLMHVNQHLSSAMPNLSGSIPSRKLSDWKAMYAASDEMLKLLKEDIQVIDPASLFCDDDHCYVTKDGIALFFDDDHISLAGAKLIVNQFIGVLNIDNLK